MKKITILYGLISFLSTSLSTLACADVVTVLSDKWYPMNGDPNSSRPGYMIEIAQNILNKNGHSLDYRLAPWKRSILEVRRGSVDCVVGAHKPDAEDFVFPKNSWGEATFKFYTTAKSSWNYQSISQLNTVKLGAISAYSYGPELDRYIKGSKHPSVQLTTGEKALEQNIRKLLANRIDTVIAHELVMSAQLKTLNISSDIKSAGALEFTELMYIACSPNKESSKKYIQLFSDGIVELRKNGELKQILQKYGIEDWEVGS